ncbi:hypothetical protein F5Y06DRAFT_271603 [Hypoxylon sp. FL0890]|nr:hypothetical protein F5Y06DRAFT_271603 [Hypoxylon sp. FL0890]
MQATFMISYYLLVHSAILDSGRLTLARGLLRRLRWLTPPVLLDLLNFLLQVRVCPDVLVAHSTDMVVLVEPVWLQILELSDD